ncbi:MAG: tyrosine-type recombinase/integrase [Nitrososphaeraceae archaeon]
MATLENSPQVDDNDEAYFNFINSIKSESTKELYESNIKLFLKFCNVSELKDLLKIDAQRYIIRYIMSLRESKLASNSITSRLNPVFHFYAMNDVILNKKKIKMFKGEFVKKSRDRAYFHEEIKKILDVSDLRMKIVILLMTSTGCRVGALPSLRLRNLEKIDSSGIYKITIYEGSVEQYTTFCTPECASFIDSYLEFREKNGEKLHQDSYLIRDQFDITDIEQIRNKSKGISRHTVMGIVENALLKAGVKTVDHTLRYNRKEVMKCHGFRKFAFTAMSNARINAEIREMLVGHKMNLASCYYRPTEEEMLQEYEKAIDNLTIDPANRLRRKVETLEIEKSRMDRIELKFQLLEKQFNERKR